MRPRADAAFKKKRRHQDEWMIYPVFYRQNCMVSAQISSVEWMSRPPVFQFNGIVFLKRVSARPYPVSFVSVAHNKMMLSQSQMTEAVTWFLNISHYFIKNFLGGLYKNISISIFEFLLLTSVNSIIFFNESSELNIDVSISCAIFETEVHLPLCTPHASASHFTAQKRNMQGEQEWQNIKTHQYPESTIYITIAQIYNNLKTKFGNATKSLSKYLLLPLNRRKEDAHPTQSC